MEIELVVHFLGLQKEYNVTADFNKPQITDDYVLVLQSIRELLVDLSKGLDSTGTLNVPIGALRWNSTNNRFEKYNGTVWNPLSANYSIDVVSVNGKSPSNSSGGLSINNGVLNVNLNSELLNGLQSSAFSRSASGLSQSVIAGDTRGNNHLPQDRDPGTFFDFRQNSVDGLSDGGTYHRVLSFHANSTGTDFLGTRSNQLGFTDNGNAWTRVGLDSTWNAWTKLISDANFDSTIGSGARNIVSPTVKGSFKLRNSLGGFSGFEFASGVGSDGLSILTAAGQTGEYDVVASSWKWRWDNGVLNVGSIPWARITGAPTTQDLSTFAIGTYIFAFAYDNNNSESIAKNIGETITRTTDPGHSDFGLSIRMRSGAGVTEVPLLTTWKMLGMCKSGFTTYGDEMTALWLRIS